MTDPIRRPTFLTNNISGAPFIDPLSPFDAAVKAHERMEIQWVLSRNHQDQALVHAFLATFLTDAGDGENRRRKRAAMKAALEAYETAKLS